MSDPITLAVLAGAAAGGAAGKFTEIAVESGKQWIGKYFNNHQPKAQEKAQQNGLDFLVELSTRVKVLEESHTVTQEKIAKIQEDPDFSAALQKALISSAQTENKEKHQVLADILVQRLTADSESVLALTTKMSLDVVSFLTPNQLNILAVSGIFYLLQPNTTLNSFMYEEWLINTFHPFIDTKIGVMDLNHLESLSCIRISPMISKDFRQTLKMKNHNTSVSIGFFDTPEAKKIEYLFKNRLEHLELTTIGMLIAVTMFNLKSSTPTPITGNLFED